MAFRLPNAKKFRPSINKGPVARKASIPASLAKPPASGSTSTPGHPGASGTGTASTKTPRSTQAQPPSNAQPSPSPVPTPSGDGLPPGIGSTPTPIIGSSHPPGTFREPSLPPSRKRAASPTPSNASKSSRTGGRPTLIHLAANSGPARRPTPSPSPAPASTTVPASALAQKEQHDAPAVPDPRTPPASTSSLPVVGNASAKTPQAATLPSPARATYGSQPPTIGNSQPPAGQITPPTQTTQPTSSMIDPRLLDQSPGAGPSQSPSASQSQVLSTADLASQLVAGINELPAGKKIKAPKLTKAGVPRKYPANRASAPPRTNKRKKGPEQEGEARASATPAPEGQEDGAEGETAEASASAPPKPKRTYKRKTPELDEYGHVVRKKRGPYGSRGRAQTEYDRRKSKYRQSRSVSNVPGADDEVDPFAEDIPVDPDKVTMGSFASNYYDGDLTERAVLLKETQRVKQDEARKERLEFERVKRIRLQPLRRRERAKRNEDRAKRRKEWEADGAPEGDEEISDDEIDSTDEEYEFEPDRLTPPGTPEPEQYDQEGEGEEEEGIRPDEARPEYEDDEEGLGLDKYAEGGYGFQGEGEEYDEEVIPENQPVDLADYGFQVAEEEEQDDQAIQQPHDPNEPEPDYAALFDINPGDEGDEFGEMDEDGGPGFSFADYTANMENRRAAALANQNSRFVVQEDDDETKLVNSITWQKRERTDKWTDDETDFFYSVLGEVGENYTMMKAFFPGRSVAQIKKKGVRENAKNPEKVTAAINARRPIDNTYLRKSAGYDPDRPWDKEEALFAEAKRDMNRLKAEDRGEIVDENGDIIGVGEPDDGLGDDHIGDEAMDFDADVQEEEDVQEGEEGDEEVEGEVAEEVEGGEEEAPAEEVDAGQEALFLPGGDDDDDDDAGSTA